VRVCPSRGPTEQFTKFVSANIGSPFIDPGSFNRQLRSPSPQARAASLLLHPKPIKSTSQNRTTGRTTNSRQLSTLEPRGSPLLYRFADRPGGFYNQHNSNLFNDQLEYLCDPYERKQDIEREEYMKNMSKVLRLD
jgi:hypothetical protein